MNNLDCANKLLCGFLLILILFTCVNAVTEMTEFVATHKKENTATPDYTIGTPAYDLSVITNNKIMFVDRGQQKVEVIGVEVMHLWLQNATNKEVVSICSFNRGLQGSTSSFLIVYYEH